MKGNFEKHNVTVWAIYPLEGLFRSKQLHHRCSENLPATRNSFRYAGSRNVASAHDRT